MDQQTTVQVKVMAILALGLLLGLSGRALRAGPESAPEVSAPGAAAATKAAISQETEGATKAAQAEAIEVAEAQPRGGQITSRPESRPASTPGAAAPAAATSLGDTGAASDAGEVPAAAAPEAQEMPESPRSTPEDQGDDSDAPAAPAPTRRPLGAVPDARAAGSVQPELAAAQPEAEPARGRTEAAPSPGPEHAKALQAKARGVERAEGVGAPSFERLLASARKASRRGQAERALGLVDKALALKPAHREATAQRAKLLLRLGRAGRALAAYEACAGGSRGYAPCLYGKGRALDALGRRSEAQAVYRHYLAVHPRGSHAVEARKKLAPVSDED